MTTYKKQTEERLKEVSLKDDRNLLLRKCKNNLASCNPFLADDNSGSSPNDRLELYAGSKAAG